MSTTNYKRPGWFFYTAWVALSTVSIPIAGTVALVLVSQTEKVLGDTIQVGGQTRITEDYLGAFFILFMLGLVAGSLQYLLLRRPLPHMGWWIAATASGFLLGLVAGRLLSGSLQSTFGSLWAGILRTALLGGSMGLLQWLVLRQRVRHAAWWILANVLGWGVLGWGAEVLSSQMVIPIVGILLTPGIATSIALWLLLDRLPRGEGSGSEPAPKESLEPAH